MAVYTFHVPRDARRGDAHALDKAALVRDGFSWAAFFFQLPWCLWNRLWLVAVGFVLVSLALSFGLDLAGVPPTAIGAAGLLLAILFALEANNLHRRSLERRGLALRGVVVAPDLREAERRAFHIWLADGAADDAPASPGPVRQPPAVARPAYATRAPQAGRRDSDVLGLFPAAEEPR